MEFPKKSRCKVQSRSSWCICKQQGGAAVFLRFPRWIFSTTGGLHISCRTEDASCLECMHGAVCMSPAIISHPRSSAIHGCKKGKRALPPDRVSGQAEVAIPTGLPDRCASTGSEHGDAIPLSRALVSNRANGVCRLLYLFSSRGCT